MNFIAVLIIVASAQSPTSNPSRTRQTSVHTITMGITDNLFQRKNLGPLKTTPRVISGSQQYRLTARKYHEKKYTEGNQNEKEDKNLKKGECVTKFVVDEQDGTGTTLVGSAQSSSLPDLSLSGLYGRSLNYPQCVCFRSACYIACDEFNCHFTGIGRVRTRCPCHPTVTFLLDLPQCPRCLGSIREYPDRIIPGEIEDGI